MVASIMIFSVLLSKFFISFLHPSFWLPPLVWHDANKNYWHYEWINIPCCVDRNAWESEIRLHCKAPSTLATIADSRQCGQGLTDNAWWNFHVWKFPINWWGELIGLEMGSCKKRTRFCLGEETRAKHKFGAAPLPPSANGLFQFPAPTSGTVFHHTLHVHRRSRFSGSVSRHFSSTCHIRTWFSDFPPTSLWTLR